MTIDSADDSIISNRTINTNRISNRTYDSKSNRITKLRRSLLCTPVTACRRGPRGSLRSVTISNLVVPRCRLSTYGTRAFSVAGPVCCNALLDYLKSSDLLFDCFGHQLKHFYFVNTDTTSALETLSMHYTNVYCCILHWAASETHLQ